MSNFLTRIDAFAEMANNAVKEAIKLGEAQRDIIENLLAEKSQLQKDKAELLEVLKIIKINDDYEGRRTVTHVLQVLDKHTPTGEQQ